MRARWAVWAIALTALLWQQSSVRAQQGCFGATCQSNVTALPLTTFVTQPAGVIYKGSTAWLHDFNYGANGTVTTDGFNVFLGGAGNFTMGSTAVVVTQGSRNIGVGYDSLLGLTTGNNNVAIGFEALKSATSSSLNVAIGPLALKSETTGSQNVAIGYNTLSSQVGGPNTAVGYSSMRFVTDGYHNSVLGYSSLNSLTSGDRNLALGQLTGGGLSTGNANTIVGGGVSGLAAALSNNVILADGDGIIRARAVPAFSLTDNTITTFAALTLGNDTGGGGSFDYCVYAADATTGGLECGRVDFAGIDVTAGAGGEVCPTPTKVGTPIQALSGSTLSVTFAASTGTDLCNIRVTADTNIATPVALNITWWAVNSGRTLTPQ